jgi:hypothetical protein
VVAEVLIQVLLPTGRYQIVYPVAPVTAFQFNVTEVVVMFVAVSPVGTPQALAAGVTNVAEEVKADVAVAQTVCTCHSYDVLNVNPVTG